MKILVLVPAYNEEKNIERVINEIKIQEPNADILIIDDGSSDKTAFVAEQTKKATVIHLFYNLGIGGAVQTGFKYAKRNHYELVVRIDGDGQHRAEDIKKLTKLMLDKEIDLVIGSRFLKKDNQYPIFGRRIGQKIISVLVSLMSGQNITDSTSGFRCYNRNLIALLTRYYPTDYPEPEEIIFLKKNKFQIKEVDVLMRSREKGKSSLTTIKSVYYIIKVALSIFISFFRAPIIK